MKGVVLVGLGALPPDATTLARPPLGLSRGRRRVHTMSVRVPSRALGARSVGAASEKEVDIPTLYRTRGDNSQ